MPTIDIHYISNKFAGKVGLMRFLASRRMGFLELVKEEILGELNGSDSSHGVKFFAKGENLLLLLYTCRPANQRQMCFWHLAGLMSVFITFYTPVAPLGLS